MQKLSLIFIPVGVLFIFYSLLLIYKRNLPSRLAFQQYQEAVVISQQNSVKPINFSIPELNIDLPITPAEIKNNNWDTSTDSVSWLIASTLPGEKGNSVLYGHNWKSLLGGLEDAKTGYTVEILYKNGVKRYFRIKNIAIVTPDQIHVLDQSDDIRLTIYTCAGFLDRERLVLTAVYESQVFASKTFTKIK